MKALRRALVFGLASWCLASGPLCAATALPFESNSLTTFAAAHPGRPVIVHFWGLTCGNCMAELADWGKFAKRNPGALIVFVNWDRRGANDVQINQALDKAGLESLPSYELGRGFEEKLRFAVDRDWMGELPYTRLIASDGAVSTFSGAADFNQLATWLAGETQRSKVTAGR
jgi:thiol-disulfide isomerase/thioredoxin